jgi:trans-aconitate 2-methyltransferase
MTEWDAAEYSRRSSLQEAMAQEVLALLDLKGSERILDVGCGDGKITAEIAARASKGSVVGVDPSQDMISFAQKHFGAAALPNLRFLVADARRLPFQNEFDLVVSFNALHWVHEQEAALSSIHSTLISGGRAQLRLVPAGARKSQGQSVRRELNLRTVRPGSDVFHSALSQIRLWPGCSRRV